MRRDTEAQKKIIMADIGGNGREAPAESGEVEPSAALMDLDGIAAAHGDVWLRLPFEMAKFASTANAAGGIALNPNGLIAARPDIKGDELCIFIHTGSDEELRSFGGFDGGDYTGSGVEHADCIAGVICAGRNGRLRVATIGGGVIRIRAEETSEARGRAGTDSHRDAVTADDGGVDPGDAELYSGIIEKKARFKIVGPVEKDVMGSKQFFRVAGCEIGDNPFDTHAAVDGAQPALGGDGFGERFTSIGFIEKGLALEVRGFDEIAVNDAERSDPRADQEVCKRGAKRAAADEYGSRSQEAALAFFADAGEKNLA
jgi:hypothetical protein